MKRMMGTLAFGLLIVGLVATSAAPVAAGDSVERPHVMVSTGVNTNGDCDLSGYPIVTCPYEGTTSGVGTHVGDFSGTYTGTVRLDFTQVCVGVNGEPGTPIVSTSDSVVVAANGDQLHSHSESTGCFVGFGIGTTYEGSVTIIGGTGRFEDATGVLETTQELVADDPSGSTSSLVAISIGTITF